ncbi:hypothetical protein GGE48_006301 [Rhizobium leguminosarum]|nr:hypothetical protein [Rhizobium leguminosarum]MBB4510280.1 hypothetical protein [Rhizobium leguminosarum]
MQARKSEPVGDHTAGHQEPHLRKLIEQPMKVCRLLIHQDHAVADAMLVSISGDGIAKCLTHFQNDKFLIGGAKINRGFRRSDGKPDLIVKGRHRRQVRRWHAGHIADLDFHRTRIARDFRSLVVNKGFSSPVCKQHVDQQVGPLPFQIFDGASDRLRKPADGKTEIETNIDAKMVRVPIPHPTHEPFAMKDGRCLLKQPEGCR